MTKTLIAAATALMIALPATAMAGQSGTVAETDAPMIDRVTTGSIQPMQDTQACDGMTGSSVMCGEHGERTIKFPSAPTNYQFGF